MMSTELLITAIKEVVPVGRSTTLYKLRFFEMVVWMLGFDFNVNIQVLIGFLVWGIQLSFE